MSRIWIVGESWVTNATHFKGFDSFTSTTFQSGAGHLRDALEEAGHQVRWMPTHEAQEGFPLERCGLAEVDVVILSDIGANTLLLHPRTWLEGVPTPNRLKLLRDWTREGGRLVMCGGYLSFQGIGGGAFYHGSPVEEALGVEISPYDDRIEAPEGARAGIADARHPILRGLEGDWPPLLGYNRVRPRPGTRVLATINGDPLLAVSEPGRGRALAWTSDVGPHWCPREFVGWSGYRRLWRQAMAWLTAG
jgi:uncharacterized membrane protein